MVRISGVNIPDPKRIDISLSYLYGLGRFLSAKILKIANVPPEKRAKDLSSEEIGRIQEVIDKNYRIEGDLRREIQANVRRLKEIGSYRGSRHARKLPARGQRTKTNSRTVRGNTRKTVGSGRRKMELR